MTNQTYSITVDSPVGILKLEASESALTAIHFIQDDAKTQPEQNLSPLLQKTAKELQEYFEGKRQTFDITLQPAGTDFERDVWEQLRSIPYGSSTTYGELATRLGDMKKVRAVGRANGQNPIPIIIPCHRVIGRDNKLTGYAGGIKRKQWLLQHEGVLLI